ncbi:DNA-binding response regulator [Candidatus Epulonipiscium fishelsonii]|uniref:DNA-binding response regulator n=1 Tax=Candidatus Epulonipiscium fishelsonii TaxID=77094 RepID=A0ACC8XCJ3_9FIRM|nr:DNA-binding response regulator [Epulopiscium sp. SCG-B05WGA-EpuloA1]ONI40416.1 DNA-binding response regulator [Epulopiscium sp. SCG-B11WGA-EpuloA1]
MIVSGLKYALECEGYITTHCENVKSSLETINSNRFDLAILDIRLPDGTGFDVAKKLTSIPIIFLTAVDDEQKIVNAFDLGAADYVTKPFRVRELLARIKRTLNQNNAERSYINIGDVKIDTDSGKVYVAENMIQLTALEYRLLLIFANQKGKLLKRTQILESIWDYEGNFVEDNTLTVYIKRIREKLGNAINIETVRGVGYRAN